MVDDDEMPCSGQSKVDRNTSRKSRKRRFQAGYYPPRKRARIVDVHIVTQQIHGKTTGVGSSLGYTPTTECRKYCERSKHPKHCKRRLKLMRLLKGKTLKSAPSSIPFRELIARGTIAHILRECQSKALAKKQTANDVDSLYGYGDDTLHFPARTFGLSALRCKDGKFKNSMMKVRKGRSTYPPSVIELEGNSEMPKDLNDEKLPTRNVMGSQCKTSLVNGHDKDDFPVSRDDVNVQISQTISTEGRVSNGTIRVDSYRDPETESSSNEQANCAFLPFSFMPGTFTYNSSSTPRRAVSAQDTYSRSSTQKNKPVFYHRNITGVPGSSSHHCSRTNTCIYTSGFSPIRPRISKGPRMALIDSPLSHPSFSFAENVQPSTPTSDRNSARIPLSPPFKFMPGDHPTQQSTFNSMSTEDSSNANRADPPHSNLFAAIVKYVISFSAKLVLSFRTKVQDNDISNPSSPLSLQSAIPSRPHDSPSNVRLGSTAERSIATRNIPYRSQISSSNNTPGSSRPFPPASNKAFLSTNQKSSVHEPEFGVGESKKMPSSARSKHDHYVKNPSDLLPAPPRGWEYIFQPKDGEWKCEACYYINPAEAMTCDSCTALKERADGNESSEEDGEKDQLWQRATSEADAEPSKSPNEEECQAPGGSEKGGEADPASAEANATEEDGASSKRIKVTKEKNLHGDVRHPPEPMKERSQNPRSTSSKRIKVDQELHVDDNNSPEAMCTELPYTSSGSKKRNKSDDNDGSNQVIKAAREHVDGMAMDDTSLHNEVMDVE